MQIYQTQNRALAITLATCGCKPPRPVGREDKLSFVHIYDEKHLAKMTDGRGQPMFKGLTFAEAAKRAFRAGIPGIMVYNFVRDELLERIIKAFNGASKALEEAEVSGVPAGLTVDVSPEDAAKLCVQFTANRNLFTHGWKTMTPYLHMPGASDTRTEGGKTFIIGSFRLVPMQVEEVRSQRSEVR